MGVPLAAPLRAALARAAAALPPARSPAQHGLRAALVVVAVAGLVAVAWSARYAWAVQRLRRGVGNTMFYTAEGRPWFPLDEHRRDVPLADMPVHLRHAVVAVEDHRFYGHPGVDAIGIGRAFVRNLTRDTTEGGSTITQQTARVLFLNNERSYMRKAKEAVIARMLEMQLGKEAILELYLNRVYLGAGTYGVEAMSRELFGRPVKQLPLAESALLAGLVQSPSALSPWSNYDRALARSAVVLRRMREEGYITAAQEQAAARARPAITREPGRHRTSNGYAKEYLRQLFRDEVGNDHPPDWRVDTTIVPALQRAAEEALVAGLRRLGRPDVQGALVALDPETGDVLALVGGKDFQASPFNRAVKSRRQPGSAFKPFVFAAALERGLSPVSVLNDLDRVVAPARPEWTPRNTGDDDATSITLREALLESNNRAAVALQTKVGTGPVRRLAADAGIEDLPDVPSLALGTGLVTPLELTTAYAVFPNGGEAVRPRGIRRIRDADGDVVAEWKVRRSRAISRESAFQMVSMLRDVVDHGTASAARQWGLRIPVGGKTGTTNEFKDAWFVGFSTSVVAGVWVGYDQPRPIGDEAYAARVALPIWTAFMGRASTVRAAEAFDAPLSLEPEELCHESYLKPVEGCPTYVEYFKRGDDVPSRLCPVHRGSMKQRVRRFFDDVLRRVGGRIVDIFR
jgi:penicillin-binding protein 1A